MIIDNLYLGNAPILCAPFEDDPILIVNSDAVFT